MNNFYWKEQDGLKLLVSSKLEAAGFVNGFSTRLGGVSPFPSGDLNLAGYGDDTEENIAENRRRFLRFFPDGFSITTVWQVHSDVVRTVRSPEEASATEEKADAIVSDLDRTLAGVKTADCVPVLIGDPRTGAFASIHAGWKGTLAGIAGNAVDRMAAEFGSDPADLVVAIGPAACGRRYEVGPEVVDAFGREFPDSERYFSPTSGGHALVDLHLANIALLAGKGVREANISSTDLCTMERTDLFFSYRIEHREQGKTGRLMSVIGREG